MALDGRSRVSDDANGRRRRFDRWRLVSPTGAEVVSLRQLGKTERLRVTAPTIFTILNMMSGLSSVLLAFREHFTLAAVLIAVSIIMDIADGGVARLVGATSPFGLQMDSLADLISFGFAPAILVHTWALPDYPVLSVLALVEQTRGGSGAYGTTADAAERLPALPETAEVGTEGDGSGGDGTEGGAAPSDGGGAE